MLGPFVASSQMTAGAMSAIVVILVRHAPPLSAPARTAFARVGLRANRSPRPRTRHGEEGEQLVAPTADRPIHGAVIDAQHGCGRQARPSAMQSRLPSAYVATSVSRPNAIDVTLMPTSASPVSINPILVTAGNIGSRTCAA